MERSRLTHVFRPLAERQTVAIAHPGELGNVDGEEGGHEGQGELMARRQLR